MNRILWHTFNRRGLGHLMRGMNIARAIQQIDPSTEILFYTRGIPPQWKEDPNQGDWQWMIEPNDDPTHWDRVVAEFQPHIIVYDTMVPKRLHSLKSEQACSVYIMRRCKEDQLQIVFASPTVRAMDLILVPHTEAEFGMSIPQELVKTTRFVGPIVRSVQSDALREVAQRYRWNSDDFVILSTPGGGGFEDETTLFLEFVRRVHRALCDKIPRLRHLVVPGPKYSRNVRPEPQMEVIPSEPRFLELLASVDLVISAGGYNTVHEIRESRTPSILLPSPRTHDDQWERVQSLASAGLAVAIADWECESSSDSGTTSPGRALQQVIEACCDFELHTRIRKRAEQVPLDTGNTRAAEQILRLASSRTSAIATN